MLQHTWEILSVKFCASSGVPTFERKCVLVEVLNSQLLGLETFLSCIGRMVVHACKTQFLDFLPWPTYAFQIVFGKNNSTIRKGLRKWELAIMLPRADCMETGQRRPSREVKCTDTTVCLRKSVWDSSVAPGITHMLEAIQGFLCVNYEFHMDEAHAFY